MSDTLTADLPDLSLSPCDSSSSLSLESFQPKPGFLSHSWGFTNCTEFCEEFGIRNKTLLQSVFEKIKRLSTEEADPKVFERLYQASNTPLFIKKIMAFPEFIQYLSSQNADHCLGLLSKRIQTCERHKKLVSHIIALFKKQPTQACLALVRFTQSADALPAGEEKNQLLWLLAQTKHAWYKENYLVHHALNSSFLVDYLNTHPHWAPCVDFVLTLVKDKTNFSVSEWDNILGLAHYNTTVFCETLSEMAVINLLDLSLFNVFLRSQPESLEDFLKLSQNHPARFTAWVEWVMILPQQANIFFSCWQNHLVHLADESANQEKALATLTQKIKTGELCLSPENKQAFDTLIQNHLAFQQKTLTNREKDQLPEAKRYLITEMLLLGSVKATCWAFGASLYMPSLIYELYNQKIAPKLGTPPTSETGFDPAFYGMYAAVGKPLSGNRIFEYTGQESFKNTFLNGFKLFKCPGVGKQYFEHVNSPKISDAEFYERVLAKPYPLKTP